MIKDIEGHTITMVESPNPHIMITGASGEGKTTAAICPLNDNACDQGRKALVTDQSGGYTAEQMKEHGAVFSYADPGA